MGYSKSNDWLSMITMGLSSILWSVESPNGLEEKFVLIWICSVPVSYMLLAKLIWELLRVEILFVILASSSDKNMSDKSVRLESS